MNEYLEKPLDNEALLGAVQRLVPGDSPRPPRPPQSSARPAQEPDGPAGQEPGGQEPDGPEPGGPDADAGSEVPGSRGSRSEVPGQAASGSAASGAADQRELPAFDGEELLSRLRSTKLARTVAEGFLTHLDDRAKAIHEALEDGTYTEIRSAAHNLASPAANAGAVALRALLKEMEAAAVAGDAEEVRATAARLDAEVAAARAAAERFLAEE
jgi:HPt (histidine-containing phosphotransfer) domain-containing protein